MPPTSPTCGYDLTRLPKSRCSECGKHFDLKKVRYQANCILVTIDRVNHVNKDVKLGLFISLICWVAVGLVRLPGLRAIMEEIDLMAIVAALLSLVLGMQVVGFT